MGVQPCTDKAVRCTKKLMPFALQRTNVMTFPTVYPAAKSLTLLHVHWLSPIGTITEGDSFGDGGGIAFGSYLALTSHDRLAVASKRTNTCVTVTIQRNKQCFLVNL